MTWYVHALATALCSSGRRWVEAAALWWQRSWRGVRQAYLVFISFARGAAGGLPKLGTICWRAVGSSMAGSASMARYSPGAGTRDAQGCLQQPRPGQDWVLPLFAACLGREYDAGAQRRVRRSLGLSRPCTPGLAPCRGSMAAASAERFVFRLGCFVCGAVWASSVLDSWRGLGSRRGSAVLGHPSGSGDGIGHQIRSLGIEVFGLWASSGWASQWWTSALRCWLGAFVARGVSHAYAAWCRSEGCRGLTSSSGSRSLFTFAWQ